MGEMLLIAPSDWEQLTSAQLQILVDNQGNIEGVQAILAQAAFSQLHIIDEDRFGINEIIVDAMILQDSMWIKVQRN